MSSSLHHSIYDAADAVALGKGSTVTADFDDINTGKDGEVEVKDGYSKMDWDNFYAITPSTAPEYQQYKGSGFFTGVTSGKNDAYNGEGFGCDVHLLSGTFTLDSVEMTAAFDKKMKVEIYAFDDKGHVKYDKFFDIDDKGPTLIKLGYKDVHEVDWHVKSEVTDPVWGKKGDAGPYIAFDDFKFSDIDGKSGEPLPPARHGSQSAALHGYLDVHLPASHADPHFLVHAMV